MDQLGDITRYIPLPLGLNKYLKIPVGFGMPQMAWNKNFAFHNVSKITKSLVNTGLFHFITFHNVS